MNETDPEPHIPESEWSRLRHTLFGKARDFYDPTLGHRISLVAFLAWIGLGADGLSSSAYGPDEAFRALGSHSYLAPFLVIAMTLTVLIISYSYSKIIEHFPEGGGGYIVATKLLGNTFGVVSGSALLVDYILTITVSIAAGTDAIFSLLPLAIHSFKLPIAVGAIFFLTFMNLRGVKESVSVLVPIFIIFILTHAIIITAALLGHAGDFVQLPHQMTQGYATGVHQLGTLGLLFLLLRAYSMGGGTYTGIEAVSNGLSILREPKVVTGKKTMTYMAFSLAITAGGLLLSYNLLHITPSVGQTLNAVLVQNLAGGITLKGLPIGHWFVWITIFSEAVLLLVAAQTGFIDGPRIMSNMAIDSWLPKRFSALSDRLTTQRGLLLMSLAALITLAYTRGDVRTLVVMYSINVFITFSLSQLGMCRFWIKHRENHRAWISNLFLHGIGFLLCASILIVMSIEKMREGGWITLAVTTGLIGLCFAIRKHYTNVSKMVTEVSTTFDDIPPEPNPSPMTELNPELPTAVILVGGGYSRTGVHTFFTVLRYFPEAFKNFIFVSVGVINSDFFKGEKGTQELEAKTREALSYYINLSSSLGFPAQGFIRVGTDIASEASKLCVEVSKEFPRSVFFASELVFQEPRWYQRLLHNETAYTIQRQLRFAGLSVVILPILLFNKVMGKIPGAHAKDIIYRGVVKK